MKAKYAVVPTAAITATSATIARTLSTGLIVAARTGATGAEGRGAVAGARWAGAAGAGRAGAAAGGVGAKGTLVGPPGGSVGNLIVGAADGLGGKLIRTVSFLGWTLPVDFFIGSAPWGAPGTLGISAIILI